jgi:cytochrome c oxidase subunit III
MPAVKTPGPPRISAPDSGGRGTGHKLPTGGGGEGEWSNRPPERRGPRERLNRARTGLAVLLTTSLGLFATLALGYLWRRGHEVFDPLTNSYVSVWHPIAIPSLLWWNTALLIVSSVTLEMARRAYFREDVLMDEWLGISRPTLVKALPWEGLSFLLASGFVAGQLYAWGQLRAQGVFLGNGPSSQFYYFLTGLHGIHLLGGMVVLVWTMIAALIGRSLESRRIAVDITAWYWHAITVVWFGVFALLKLCE